MNNNQREAVYLRDRTRLTPAQRRRISKHNNGQQAVLSRSMRRAGRRHVLSQDRKRRLSIRSLFASRRSS